MTLTYLLIFYLIRCFFFCKLGFQLNAISCARIFLFSFTNLNTYLGAVHQSYSNKDFNWKTLYATSVKKYLSFLILMFKVFVYDFRHSSPGQNIYCKERDFFISYYIYVTVIHYDRSVLYSLLISINSNHNERTDGKFCYLLSGKTKTTGRCLFVPLKFHHQMENRKLIEQFKNMEAFLKFCYTEICWLVTTLSVYKSQHHILF